MSIGICDPYMENKTKLSFLSIFDYNYKCPLDVSKELMVLIQIVSGQLVPKMNHTQEALSDAQSVSYELNLKYLITSQPISMY